MIVTQEKGVPSGKKENIQKKTNKSNMWKIQNKNNKDQ